MAEPTDIILPILQEIQTDLAGVTTDLAEVKEALADHGRRLTEMNGYLSISLNVTMRHTDEIDSLRGELAALKRPVAAFERPA